MLRQKSGNKFRPVAEIRACQPVQRVPQIHQTSSCRKVKYIERSGNLEAFRQRHRRAPTLVDENQIGTEGQAERYRRSLAWVQSPEYGVVAFRRRQGPAPTDGATPQPQSKEV